MIIKRCACGASYTWEQWQELPDKKLADLECEPELGEPDILEQRQCPCGSHINIGWTYSGQLVLDRSLLRVCA